MRTFYALSAVICLTLTLSATARCAGPDTPVTLQDGEPPGAGIRQGLQGRVIAPDGAPIEGALIQPRSLDGAAVPEMAVLTKEDGRYSWSLRPGRYEVSVSAEGYQTATKPSTVSEGQLTTLDFTLSPVP